MVPKVFVPGNKQFKGAFNYVYQVSGSEYPKIEITGTKEIDDPIALITKPLESNVAYAEGTNTFTNVDIDLGKFKVLPSHYQLSTNVGGTPPLLFSLQGSNNKSESWIPIDSNRYDPYLCPYTMGSTVTQCATRGIKLITPNHIVGPFRYIRFVVHASRWELGYSTRSYSLRLSGIELYGNLYNNDADVFRMKSCVNKIKHIPFSYVFLVIITSK